MFFCRKILITLDFILSYCLHSDFNFIGDEIDDQKIEKMSKQEYKSYLQKKISIASFK